MHDLDDFHILQNFSDESKEGRNRSPKLEIFV